MDLETILNRFNGREFKVFNQNGQFTKKGYNVYCDFCSFIYDLNMIVDGVDPEFIEKQLEQIINE